jgi:hypothetical protein
MAGDNRRHAQSMIRLYRSHIAARVIYAAAKLGLVDHIGEEGAAATELAQMLGLHPGALFRVLRTLAGLGVLHQDANDQFFVTPFGETLRKDSAYSVRDFAISSHEFVNDALRGIVESIRTGKPVVEDLYKFLAANPEQEASFHAGMSNRGRLEVAAVLDIYDFSSAQRVVDVGGGNGGFLSGILLAYGQLSGILFDRPSAIDAAKAGRGGPLPRCELVAGNFFDGVPHGGDTYVLKRVLFGESDEDALRILRNCREAMHSGTRLLIIEPLIGPRNEHSPAHLFDMTFLVLNQGQMRSSQDYGDLLSQAGFRVQRTLSTESEVSVLEASAF